MKQPFQKNIDKAAAVSGFTLIEVMIALGIFSLGLLAASALQNASLKSTGNIARTAEALTVLEDHTERLKAMPFYANDDGMDNDADGDIDEIDETLPELVAGEYNVARVNGRYVLNWRVVDDVPIGQQDETVLPGVTPGNYTVSKTIFVRVARAGQNPQTQALAMVEFVKTWAAEGMP